jgi:hypothetical protein
VTVVSLASLLGLHRQPEPVPRLPSDNEIQTRIEIDTTKEDGKDDGDDDLGVDDQM